MVIPSMTFFELYEDLAADHTKIKYKHQQLMPGVVKRFQIVELFQSSKANISEHIKTIYVTNELDSSTVRKIRTVRLEGGRSVTRSIDYYNED